MQIAVDLSPDYDAQPEIGLIFGSKIPLSLMHTGFNFKFRPNELETLLDSQDFMQEAKLICIRRVQEYWRRAILRRRFFTWRKQVDKVTKGPTATTQLMSDVYWILWILAPLPEPLRRRILNKIKFIRCGDGTTLKYIPKL